MRIDKTFYYLTVFCIIITSFLFYSSIFYPLLSSDDALNILMAHYYKLPDDIYCWGQDRGGTLIPLISQFFIRFLNFSALTSVSISNYLILILGFIGFSSLFQRNFYKIIFAVLWFFPFQRFIDLLRYPIGVEYSLIAIAILLYRKIDFNVAPGSRNNTVLLIFIPILLIIAVWVSDLAIVTIALLILVIVVFRFLYNEGFPINKAFLFYLIFNILLGICIIKYAKSFSVIKTKNYLSVNDINAVKNAIFIIKNSFHEVFSFKTKEIFISLYSYLVVLFLGVLSVFIAKKKIFKNLFSNIWITFFFCDFVAIFIAFLLASWVLANGMGRWYFVASYISLSESILLIVEQIEMQKLQVKYLKIFMVVICLIGAISPVFTMKYVRPKTLRPKAALVKEFQQLGEIGVIGDFWNSYIISTPDPERVRATPHDQCYQRNQNLVDSVFERKNLFIVRDMWMDSFPDSLIQYGYLLKKVGTPTKIGGCDVCKYEKIKIRRTFHINELKHNATFEYFDNSTGSKVVSVSSACKGCTEGFLVHGPYMPLGKGEFVVSFFLKATNFSNDNPVVLLDVNAKGGNQLASKKIFKNSFSGDEYDRINLEFKTTKRYQGIEFRVYYYVNADVSIDHIELNEI